VLLPTFVAAGVTDLQRIAAAINVQREVSVFVGTEQAPLARIKSVMQFLEYIFRLDAGFPAQKSAGKPVAVVCPCDALYASGNRVTNCRNTAILLESPA
jgi:hypothetical protein